MNERRFITTKGLLPTSTYYNVCFWPKDKRFNDIFHIHGGDYFKTYKDENIFLEDVKIPTFVPTRVFGISKHDRLVKGDNGEVKLFPKFLDAIEYIQNLTDLKWDNLRSDMPIAAVSTKTYGDEKGFPVAYRQWRAESHCNVNHGYNMKFHFEFECCDLDVRNWCVDYGSLRSLKEKLDDWFDHKTLVSEDDPKIESFKKLAEEGLANITYVAATGCEALARFLWDYSEAWLIENGYSPRVRMRRVEVRETAANMAYVTRD